MKGKKWLLCLLAAVVPLAATAQDTSTPDMVSETATVGSLGLTLKENLKGTPAEWHIKSSGR